MIYSRYSFQPHEWLTFIELHGFSDDWAALGLDDDDLLALQLEILVRPKGAPVVKGTGGLRKLRFAPKGKGKGKSKSVRVGYAYLEKHGIVLLIIAYPKNEKADLSANERKLIRQLLQKIDKELSEPKDK